MQSLFEPLTVAFRKNSGFLDYGQFYALVKKHTKLSEDAPTVALLIQAAGYPIEEKLDGYIYKPMLTPYEEQEYVIIDIETNGSKPGTSQVIEIGGLKVKNGKIIDKIETFVACTYIPQNIIELTGIELSDLEGAPSRKRALRSLREFTQDAIFVAHNVAFDYTFLSASFKRFGLGCMGNGRLCTIELAKRTIKSPKYGLLGLCETLDIDMLSHHRAYSDALCSWEIMQESLKRLPAFVKSADDLILFSQSTIKQRKTKRNATQS